MSVMNMTSGTLEELLANLAGSGEAVPARNMTRSQLVAIAREHRLLPTLAAAWAADGQPINAEWRRMIEACRTRARRYGEIERYLLGDLGLSARTVKGRLLTDLYPINWVRATTDLDLETDDADGVAAVGQALQRTGWAVTNVAVFRDAEGPRFALDILDPTQNRPSQDWVQVQGFAFQGDSKGVLPVGRCPELLLLSVPERCLVELAAGAARRGHILGRDLLDACLLGYTGALSGIHAAVDRLGVWPEWATLNSRLERFCPARVPDPGAEVRYAKAIASCRDRRRTQARLAATVGKGSPRNTLLIGHPLEGSPLPDSARGHVFQIVEGAGDEIAFSSPFGEGYLRPVR